MQIIRRIRLIISFIIHKPSDSWSLWKSLWFNFKYLPFKEAVRLPILISSKVQIRHCYKGCFKFLGGVKFGIVQVGYIDNNGNFKEHCSLNIQGSIIIHGTGMHAFGGGLRLKVNKGAVVEFGNNFGVSNYARINVAKRVSIGNDNMWSYEVNIMDTDSHPIFDETGKHINPPKEVCIGNDVWLASKCTILKGVTIPDGTVVAAGSIISKSIQDTNCIVTSGSKIIRRNVRWARK